MKQMENGKIKITRTYKNQNEPQHIFFFIFFFFFSVQVFFEVLFFIVPFFSFLLLFPFFILFIFFLLYSSLFDSFQQVQENEMIEMKELS